MSEAKVNHQNKVIYATLANFSRAIGHPSRLAVIQAIAERGGWINGEIVEVPDLSSGTVITHLRELKRAGIITGKIFGSKSSYGIDRRVLNIFMEHFNSFMGAVSGEQSANPVS